MLQIHNSKISKILGKYKESFDLKKKAKELGISVEELKKTMKETEEKENPLNKKSKKQTKKKSNQQVDITIKMKGADGNVISFDD